jgi:hypothetical protein
VEHLEPVLQKFRQIVHHVFVVFKPHARFVLYSIYTSKDAVGSITWASSDTNLEQVEIELLLVVVPSMLQYRPLNGGSTM